MKQVLAAVALWATVWCAPQSLGQGAAVASEVIPVKYVLASDIGTLLSQLGQGATPYGVRTHLQEMLDVGSLENQLERLGPVRVITDERSNALLVHASPSDLIRIKDIVRQLDTTLAQVLIEAVVVEVSLTDANSQRRVQGQLTGGAHPLPSFSAATNLSIVSTAKLLPAAPASAPARPGSEFSYLARLADDLDAAIHALQTNGQSRILERPRVQTSVGVPAEIRVGEVNHPTNAFLSGGCTCASYIQWVRTGATLAATCVLTTDGTILTDIQQQMDSVTGLVAIANVGNVPVTTRTTRSQAFVSLHDRETVMLGGLIVTERTPMFAKVPQLDRIPTIGKVLNRWLTYPTRKKRYEMVVLLRPILLPPPPKPPPAPPGLRH